MHNINIFIVIVTYNRLKYLQKTVFECVKTNTNIIVVNNNSIDGTLDYLEKVKHIYENIYVFNLEKNIGGSGGFAFGISKAIEYGADWIWVMDDDVYPVEGSLGRMLPYTRRQSKKVLQTGFLLGFLILELQDRFILKILRNTRKKLISSTCRIISVRGKRTLRFSIEENLETNTSVQ